MFKKLFLLQDINERSFLMAKHKVDIVGINTSEIKVLSNKETLLLLKEYKTGKVEAKETLILGNLKLVLSVVKNFSSRHDNQDDLFQIGCIGLIKAIENFNPEFNLQFSTYAVPMIVGEIKRYLRDNTTVRISRQIKDLAYRLLKEKENYQATYFKEISEEELAKRLDVSKEEIKIALDSTSSIASLYDTVYSDQEDEILLIDQIKDEQDTHDYRVDTSTLKDALATLSEVQQKVINDRYYLGKTQFEIASEFNISQAQVSRIEKSAIANIRGFFY